MSVSGRVIAVDNLVSFCQIFLQDLVDPFSIIDKDYRILWGNRKKAAEHGLKQEAMSGKICYEFFFQRKNPCAVCPVKNVLESKKVSTIEKNCELATGRQVWCQQRAIPLFDKNQDINAIIVYGFHTTDKKIKEIEQCRYIEKLEKSLLGIRKDQAHIFPDHDEHHMRSHLTDREIEVLNLIAEGYTNPEISDLLSISVHTAKAHVINIFNKLGVNNRTQAAVVAAFHQLIPYVSESN